MLLKSTLKYYVKAVTHKLETASNFQLTWHHLYKKSKVSLIQEKTADFIKNHSLRISSETLDPEPPWLLITPTTDITLSTTTDKTSPHTNRIQSLEFLSQYKEYKHIYTDGSKTNDHTGFGIYIPSEQIKRSIKLPYIVDIFTAEAYAITNAITQAILHNFKKTLILSDSLSVIQAIRNRSSNPIITEIISLINIAISTEIEIIITWIPSHCFIMGNEIADFLAKDAVNNKEIYDIPFFINHHFNNIHNYIGKLWQKQWDCSKRHNYKHIQPNIKFFPTQYSDNNIENKIITELALDNPPLNYYNSKINKTVNPNCDTCNIPETTVHFLFSCNKFSHQRVQLQQLCNKFKVPFNIKTIFNSREITPHFTRLISQIKT